MSFANLQTKWMTRLVPIGCALLLGCSGGQKKVDAPPPVTTPPPVEAPPAVVDNGKPVDVKLQLDAISAAKGAFEMQPGDTLKTGDRMAVRVSVDQPAYVYVTLISGDGNSQRLFPKAGDQQITPAEPLRVPKNPEKWITLDKSTGQENVFVYAAKKPLGAEEQLNLLNADVAAVKAAAAKRASHPRPAKAKDTPAHLTADSRGVVVEGDDDNASAASADANGVVKKRFMLQHK